MEKKGLIRSTAVVSVCTGLSRLLGFLREILMASLFGTTLFQSAFTVAFTVPNLFRRLFGEGALSAAFIPVFSEVVEKHGKEEASRLAGRMVSLLGVVLAVIVAVGFLATTACMRFLPYDLKAFTALSLLRIMFPYMFFICLVALFMAILNSYHHFAVPAATPVLLNGIWIGALLFVSRRAGDTPAEQIRAVAWVILLAGAVQLLVQLPVLAKHGVRLRISFSWRDERVKQVLVLMLPAALGMGVFQINTVIDRLLAYLVSDWAAAALRFSERLIYLPLGIFATALSTVLLPAFSRQASREETGEMKKTLNFSLRALMFVTVPATIGLLALAGPIVRLVFEWGLFDRESTLQTARALVFYAPGLLVFSLHKALVPVFYALKDTRTPVVVGAWAVLLNLALNIVFVITWPLDFKHAGLAFATVISSAANCVALGVLLNRRIGSPGWLHLFRRSGAMLVAGCMMGASARYVHSFLAGMVCSGPDPAKAGQLVAVLGSIVVSVIVYLATAGILCGSELKALAGALSRGRQRN